MKTALALLASSMLLASCGAPITPETETSPFHAAVPVGELRGADMLEASGLVASHLHPGTWWAVNDSGYGPHIHLVDSTGRWLLSMRLDSASNRDWEDLGWWSNPATGRSEILVAEIGDNRAAYDTVYVYAFEEPDSISHIAGGEQPADWRRYPMVYPDGARDAETLMVDPSSSDWYVMSKRETQVRLYRYPYPQRPDTVFVLEYVTALPITQAVGGDISRDGTEMVVKTYQTIHYWKRASTEVPIIMMLADSSALLPYIPEPQGESIAFTPDGRGFVTVSEARGGSSQPLLFYRRK